MRTECILPIILIINIINIILLLLYVFQHRVNCSSGIYSININCLGNTLLKACFYNAL